MNILISACLTGKNCRYDGENKNSIDLSEIAKNHTLFPVCPEVDGGLPIPREPAEIKGSRVINKAGEDVTEQFRRGAELALETALKNGCTVAILKARSPSCGKGEIYDGSFSKRTIIGNGITAALLQNHGIRVYTENELDKIL